MPTISDVTMPTIGDGSNREGILPMARPKRKLSPDVRGNPLKSTEVSLSEEPPRIAHQSCRRDIEKREDLAAGGPAAATTQVADGLPRRAWTVDEVERMVEVGILREPEPFELIGGELVAIAPKNRQHEVLRTELALYWGARLGRDLKIASETPLRLGEHDAPEPDLIAYPASLLAPDVRAGTVLLVVEIADTSLPADLNTKAPRYAASGLREYWVINARNLLTVVFREPRQTGEYGDRQEFQATDTLVPTLAPSLALRLADLGLS
jgi:Uma2 family endonuclease